MKDALAPIGAVTSLGSGPLFLVRLGKRPKDARTAWSHVLEKCPTAEWACPVLKDVDGNELYPTGSIVVRFREPPSADSLRKFAAASVLVLEERNEFVPRQVSFRPRRPREAYLPGLVATIAERPDVEGVWASTLGQYKRA